MSTILNKLKFWHRNPSLSLGDNFPGLVYGKKNVLWYTVDPDKRLSSNSTRNQRGEGFSLGALFTGIGAWIGGVGTTGVVIGEVMISYEFMGYALLYGTMFALSSSMKAKKPSAMMGNGLLVFRRERRNL